MPQTWKKVGFQGNPGNYAHQITRKLFPHAEAMGFATFEDVFEAATSGIVEGAVIPIDNSTIGRIADIHHLLPHTSLSIVGEAYLPIQHHLLGIKGATLKDIQTVHSQPPALAQCRKTIKAMGLAPVAEADTAGAARMVAEKGDSTQAALASAIAGEVYGLTILNENMNDTPHNTTRFVLFTGQKTNLPPTSIPCKTSLLFRVKDIPAALYKALGGFATNGINITKLESYILGGAFHIAQFYAEVESHTANPAFSRAMEELHFFTTETRILGCYPQVQPNGQKS